MRISDWSSDVCSSDLAEQINGNIDIERMKRVSLRIEAIAMALEGAGFIDVFRYFLDAGQSAEESFASAQRVFRGVPLDGGCAFTKDAVYLRGLVGDRKSTRLNSSH